MQATIQSITKDIRSGKVNVGFLINGAPDHILEHLEKYTDTLLELTVKKYRTKRSNEANAYFHLLVGMLAQELGLTFPETKNMLLADYGQRDGSIYISPLPEEDARQLESMHLVPFSYSFRDDGVMLTHYYVIKSSHTYNSKEMSRLIDGTIKECKDQGIETLTPDELERMMQDWESK